MASNSGFKRIYSRYAGAGRDVYVDAASYPVFMGIKENYQKDYNLMTIYRAVVGLNADALNSRTLNRAGDFRTYKFEGSSFDYYMSNGSIFIEKLVLSDAQRSETGVYQVRKALGSWEIKSEKLRAIKDAPQKRWKDAVRKSNPTAIYAAVSGKFDTHEDAGRELGEHIIKAYDQTRSLNINEAGNEDDEYTLFYVSKKQHKNPTTAEELASIIQQASKANTPVNWLVHGEGCHTFKAASDIMKRSPANTAKQQSNVGVRSETNAMYQLSDSGHQVYFSNPLDLSDKELEKACEAAGAHYAGVNRNPYNLRDKLVVKTTAIELAKKASSYTAKGGGATAVAIATKEVGMTAAVKAMPTLFASMTSGQYVVAAAALITIGVTAVDSFKKHSGKPKSLAKIFESTFRKGNQKWAEADA
ncbi:hypothetical protein [Agarilytica rhodophyticola]|uniref:hypothetical protein n=1 Tax=Agarilytica rhodophyticola TaxID=1737490 RepID=UPI000B345E30|nr:hypothetical protein [Agarilytica rhodophyticola]